jgi:hypothetical protein
MASIPSVRILTTKHILQDNKELIRIKAINGIDYGGVCILPQVPGTKAATEFAVLYSVIYDLSDFTVLLVIIS